MIVGLTQQAASSLAAAAEALGFIVHADDPRRRVIACAGAPICASANIAARTLAPQIAGGVLPMTMLVNGVSAGEIDGRRQRLVDPPGPGFARLTVIDATGAADTVVIRIQ